MSPDMKKFLKWLAAFLWAAGWAGVAFFSSIFALGEDGSTISILLFPPVLVPLIVGLSPLGYLLYKNIDF